MKINEFGRSMVEMLGVLAIIGVLSAGALAGYSKAMQKHRINKTIDQMSTIINNMHTVFINARSERTPYEDYKNKDATVDLILLNVFPAEMVRGQEVYNVYQGQVRIVVDEEGRSFELQFDGLPQEASVAISTMDWGVGDASGLQGVDIDTEGNS